MEGGPWWCSAQANAGSACGDSQQQSPSLWLEDHFNCMIIFINLYLLGGEDNNRDYAADILEFSDSLGEEKWTRVGVMSKKRCWHGVSVVDFVNFKDHCKLVN